MIANRQSFLCRPVLVVVQNREGVTFGQMEIKGELDLECGADVIFRQTPYGEPRLLRSLRPGTYTTQQIRDLA